MLKKALTFFFACAVCMGVQRVAAQRVAWADLPQEVVSSFYLAHPRSQFKIVHWELADMGYVSRINLEPKEISSLFQANGEWVSTRWVVPESQLPLLAHDFISEKYAFYMLRSCTYEEDRWEGRHYYALFSIYGIEGYLTEVCFDLKGNVVSIDGSEIEDLDEFEPLTEEEVLRMQENALNAKYEKKMQEEDRELALLDSVKQQKKNRRAIYRPQTKRQFIAAKVSVQSQTARKRMEQEDSLPLAKNMEEPELKPVEVQYEEQTQDLAVLQIEEEQEFAQEEQDIAEEIVEEEILEEEPLKEEQEQAPLPKPVERQQTIVSGMEGGKITMAKISVKNLFPAHVQKTFDHRFPKAENVKQYRDTSGGYRAIFTNFGQKAEAVILADGTHTTTALFFGKKDVSYPIMQYILESPEKYKFETGKRVVYESRYRQRFSAEEKPKNYYEIVVWVKDKATKERLYYLLTFDHKAHFVSKVPYDYSKMR
ncbi:MAG: hypothetical protein J1F29_06815 [Lentimicrobiaceae bacterium]|nr:hypothetical protein [Lentimicrobiaceae bacterium]